MAWIDTFSYEVHEPPLQTHHGILVCKFRYFESFPSYIIMDIPQAKV